MWVWRLSSKAMCRPSGLGLAARHADRATTLPRRCTIALVVVMTWILATGLAHAAPRRPPSPAQMLAQADEIKLNDHPRFLHLLEQLHAIEPRLTQPQQRLLEFLDAWEAAFTEHYPRAIRMLQGIIDHSDDMALVVRAKATLVSVDLIRFHYIEAFTLANSMLGDLRKVTDVDARFYAFSQIVQILDGQNQYQTALEYVARMKAEATNGRLRCQADVNGTKTLIYRGHTLTWQSPQIRETIDRCLDSHMLVYANSLRLDWADLMNEAGHPDKAIALMQRVAPDIRKAGYQMHIEGLSLNLARSYLSKGEYGLARKSAHDVIAANPPHSYNWMMQYAYEVLYKADLDTGRYKAASAYFTNYLDQYKASTEHARSQALAYQMVKQNVLAKKLKLEALSKQNRILQLRQRLDRQSAETSRLYVLVLLLVLATITLWAYRTKHSQLRFRRMAQHDDLTGAFTRQYFIEQAGRSLKRLQKSRRHACLLILDMDYFKRVNDRYGHLSGDQALRHVVRICQQALREQDIFGRMGGEEFGIFMPDCPLRQGMQTGDRIRLTLAAAPVEVRETASVTVTTSIGLACTEMSGHALESLLTDADEALYEAKHAGRNQLVVSQGASAQATA